MKSLVILMMSVLFVLLVTVGCQPKLAESPYGAKEQQWEEFIKATYPDWKPPQTVPPDRVVDQPASKNQDPKIISEEEIIIDTIEEPLDTIDVPVIEKTTAESNIENAEMEITSEFQTYTVQKGDTLWSISRKFYGSGSNWRKIFKANQDLISNPDKVKAGTELRIPSDQ